MAINQQINITANASQAQQVTQSLGASMAKSMVAANIATSALQKTLSFLQETIEDGVKSALEYEKTNIRLESSLRAAGLEIHNNMAALNAQSSQLEITAGISDETTRAMQALSLAMTGSAEVTEDLIPAAIKLSNAMGISLESAVRNLAKSTGGATGELGEFLPEIKNLTEEQKKAGGAIKLVNDRFADQLDLLQRGSGGDLNRLSNAWSSFAESIAKAALGTETITRSIQGWAMLFETLAASIESSGVMQTLGEFVTIGGRGLEGVIERAKAGGYVPGKTSDAGKKGGWRAGGMGGKKGGAKDDIVLPGLDLSTDIEIAQGDSSYAFDALFGDELRFKEAAFARERSMEEDRLKNLEVVNGEIVRLGEEREELLTSITESNAERRNKITEESTEFQLEQMRTLKDIGSDILGGFIDTAIDAFVALAEGEEGAGERVIKSFLTSTGKQLIADGIKNVFFGTVTPGLQWMVPIGAAEIGAGGIMLGGGLAIQLPSGAKTSASAGAGGSFGRDSGREDTTRLQRTVNINVFGKPTAELGRFVNDSLSMKSARGV